jgi:hypothetical protein
MSPVLEDEHVEADFTEAAYRNDFQHCSGLSHPLLAVPAPGMAVVLSDLDIQVGEHAIDGLHQPGELPGCSVPDAVTANPGSGTHQQLATQAVLCQFQTEKIGLAGWMRLLQRRQQMVFKPQPVDIPNAGRRQFFIQIGLDLFIINKAQFIDNVLFHSSPNYHKFRALARCWFHAEKPLISA